MGKKQEARSAGRATGKAKNRKNPRKAITLPGFDGQRQLTAETAEDPYGDGRIAVVRNIRHDPIVQLARQKVRGCPVLSDADVMAANRVRQLVEIIGLSQVRAMAIDGALTSNRGPRTDITDAQVKAGQQLARLARALGPDAFFIVVRVAGFGEGLWLTGASFEDDPDQAKAGQECGRHTKERVGWLLRRGLRSAAMVFGYTMPDTANSNHRRLVAWLSDGAHPSDLTEMAE